MKTNNNNEPTVDNTSAKKKKGDIKIALPFGKLRISRFNRSYNMSPDQDYINILGDDIGRNGLIHPLILVPWADGTGYDIVAGANRMRALEVLRGKDSGLADGEFVVRFDLTETDPRCFELSVAENQHRREPSSYELAVYVARIISEEKIDQIKVSKVMRLPRPTINRLVALNTWWAELPESWQKDLKVSPGVASEEPGPAITFSHLYNAVPALEKFSGPELRKLLDRARDEAWSTRELKRQLDGFDPAAESAAQANNANGQAQTDKPAAPKKGSMVDPITTATRAHDRVLKTLELLQTIGGLDQAIPMLKEVAELINQRLGLLKDEKAARTAAKKAERAKGKTKDPKEETKEPSEG